LGVLQSAVVFFDFFLCEFDSTGRGGENGVIIALFGIFTRAIASAALANNNGAGHGCLTTVDFNAQSLGVGISAQSSTAGGFLMSHILLLLLLNKFNSTYFS